MIGFIYEFFVIISLRIFNVPPYFVNLESKNKILSANFGNILIKLQYCYAKKPML